MQKLVVLLALLLCSLAISSAQYIKVNTTTNVFVDGFGRHRVFHGVNAIYKIPPWIPEMTGFDPQNSLSVLDAQNLTQWGFSAVRLGTMWPGVMPSKGQVNTTYLDQLEMLVNQLGQQGIYSLLDMHQDLISRYFCGEGMPDWAVPTPSEHFPAPLAWLNLSFEANNYPTLESCLQHPFAEFYPTAAVAETFQALYSNTGGLGDAMAQFWGAVAQRFQNNTYVLGYELLNEPFAGDIYRDPGLLLPGVTDARYLLPLYQKMHTAIRQYDQNHIIFFEPMVFDIGPSGFNEGPGGPAYNDRQVYSFHIYCQPTDKGGDPTDMRACSIEDELYWDLAMSDLKRMNLGGMLTEFGAVNDSETAVEMIDYLTGLADTAFMSWAYWQFKFYQDLTTSGPAESFYFADGSLAQAKVQALSRTHAQAIAGRPLSTTFNATTNAFSLSYQYDAAVSAPTVVYLNKPMRYPSGYSVQVSPAGSVDWTFSNNQLLFIPSTNTTHLADGTTVTIQIGPAFP